MIVEAPLAVVSTKEIVSIRGVVKTADKVDESFMLMVSANDNTVVSDVVKVSTELMPAIAVDAPKVGLIKGTNELDDWSTQVFANGMMESTVDVDNDPVL